jgi:hypothetical protein
MAFSPARFISRKRQHKAALGCPDRAVQEFPGWELSSVRTQSRHQLAIELFGVRSGDNNAAGRVTRQPVERAKRYDPLSLAAAVRRN